MSMIHRSLVVGLVAVLVGSAVGQDEKKKEKETQAVKADDLGFKVPAAWKKETPKSSMRKLQMKVTPVKGDDDPAELLVFVFAAGAGTVESNVDRWEKMFVDADKKTPKAKVEEKKGINVEATRVEISGRYVAAAMPGAAEKNDKPNYRLLGAIVETKGSGSYYLRMIGPDKTVADATKDFDAMIESLKLDK